MRGTLLRVLILALLLCSPGAVAASEIVTVDYGDDKPTATSKYSSDLRVFATSANQFDYDYDKAKNVTSPLVRVGWEPPPADEVGRENFDATTKRCVGRLNEHLGKRMESIGEEALSKWYEDLANKKEFKGCEDLDAWKIILLQLNPENRNLGRFEVDPVQFTTLVCHWQCSPIADRTRGRLCTPFQVSSLHRDQTSAPR